EHAAVLTTDAEGKLPLGTFAKGVYYLKEITTKTGYKILDEAIVINISDSGVMYGKAMTNAVETDGVFMITVANSSGYELPSTGGSGTALLHFCGLLLICLAGIGMMIFRKTTV
ncbi:MAG: hypothetical protein IKR11_11095, partial [Solobacterium sp.]|nr:hypothetical protein [Solobacterium sp.]